jgi:hypothetical protein
MCIFAIIILLNSPHPWKFCHFWSVVLQSRTDHLKLGRYLRNVGKMGLDFCVVRQCGSATTMQTHLSPVHYRNLLSNVLITSVFVAGVNHWLPIQLNSCWPTPPSSLSLHLAPLSLATTFILSVLDCTSKSTTKFHMPCVLSGICHLNENIRAAKNHHLPVLIWSSVFNENTRVIMTHRAKRTGIL